MSAQILQKKNFPRWTKILYWLILNSSVLLWSLDKYFTYRFPSNDQISDPAVIGFIRPRDQILLLRHPSPSAIANFGKYITFNVPALRSHGRSQPGC